MSGAHVAAIILAAGKGTRMKSTTENKVALPFHGKPIIKYAVEVMQSVASEVVVVVGSLAETVKISLEGMKVTYAYQADQLGTGHALQVGFKELEIKKPDMILVGYGDHMMFYKSARLNDLVALHQNEGASLSLLTAIYDDPNSLAWARVLRNEKKEVIGLAEQKDATDDQRSIQEINPGMYCFSYDFLEEYLPQITKSAVTQEYYLTELLELAYDHGKKIVALPVPFEEVGIGINRPEELDKSQNLYNKVSKS
ncbi:MAG: NTP transferase domain-containing protein [Microgenomates group bacterium]|jgi:bifunctional UDP-N-acetylglucosamine pyrophosphorylase/glucosamine-1-phosphate N-acetyltransferase|nr:NTP transferase domain-containing protein [Candidatus Woesebacteria bacterium]MBP6883276.1 NTP transferase domain-containing protein [Candidatus Woesebacteria bacterium]QQR64158.1 MAG: NTP transferase domain-containing protein [Candidatus Roizmanbacteria bacterium]